MKSKFVAASALSALLMMSLPTIALAAPAWFNADYLEITGMLAQNDGLEITLAGGSDCNRTFRLFASEPNYEVKASALMSAYYAGHEVKVEYDGDLNACNTRLTRFKVRR
jgi:hypothetical protein